MIFHKKLFKTKFPTFQFFSQRIEIKLEKLNIPTKKKQNLLFEYILHHKQDVRIYNITKPFQIPAQKPPTREQLTYLKTDNATAPTFFQPQK